MNQRRHAVAWSLTGLGVALSATTVVFAVLDPGGGGNDSAFGSGGVVGILLLILPGTSFFTVGSLLAVRRAQNAVGWLCLTIGLVWFVIAITGAASEWAFNTGRVEAAEWLGIVGAAWVPALGLLATHLPLRLPDGRLPSPRWRWFSRCCTALIVLVTIGIGADPGVVNSIPGTKNPLGSESVNSVGALFALLPLCFVVAVGSLVVRYRRADGVARRQLRVIAFGGSVCVLMFVVGLLPLVNLVPTGGTLEQLLNGLGLLFYNAFPVAIAIAVLRYRLFDIDVVINRALVYVVLTVTLVLAYVSGVLLLRLLLDPFLDDSNLAVAGSTLVVATLFRPARRRIQAAVDRRFFRSRYDAVRTLEVFSSRLREQVDIEALTTDLRSVVAETVAPSHVSLWLRS